MSKRNSEDARMLKDLLDTAADLSTYGVMSKPDMARVRSLCEPPPAYTPDRIVTILEDGEDD